MSSRLVDHFDCNYLDGGGADNWDIEMSVNFVWKKIIKLKFTLVDLELHCLLHNPDDENRHFQYHQKYQFFQLKFVWVPLDGFFIKGYCMLFACKLVQSKIEQLRLQ